MWTINLPLRVPVSKKKFFSLNLNQYRNAHYQTLDKAKKAFDKIAKDLIRGIPKLERCTLEYTLYPGTRQICDTNNVCAIVDKFFSDSLVTHGVIEDDNYNIIADSRFKFGAIDKGNPRVEVVIRSPDHIPLVPPEPLEESEDMKIQTVSRSVVTLNDDDLEQAIRHYVSQYLTIADDAEVTIGDPDEETGEFDVIIEPAAVENVLLAKNATTDTASKTTRRRRRMKMEPKEALENAGMQPVPAKEEPVPELEKATMELSQATEALDTPGVVLQAQQEKEEAKAAPPAPGKLFAVQPKQEAPSAPAEEPKAPVVAEEKGHAEATPAAKEEAPATPPTGKSLFASFRRPNNDA